VVQDLRQILDGSANIREYYNNSYELVGRVHAYEYDDVWSIIYEWKTNEKDFEQKKYRFKVYESIENPSAWQQRAEAAKSNELFEGEWSIPSVSVVSKVADQVTAADIEPDGLPDYKSFTLRHANDAEAQVVGQLIVFTSAGKRGPIVSVRTDVWITNMYYVRPTLGGPELWLFPDSPGNKSLTCAYGNQIVQIMTESFGYFSPKT
jgi:hypothetical protein